MSRTGPRQPDTSLDRQGILPSWSRVSGITPRQLIKWVSSFCQLLAGFILVAMVVITAIDVAGRYFFNAPLKGTVEIAQVLLVAIIFFGITQTGILKRHVTVDILVPHLSARRQAASAILTTIMGVGILSLIGWRNVISALHARGMGATTDLMNIPEYPFRFIIAFGAFLFALALLPQLYDAVVQVARKPGTGRGDV